MSHKLLYKGTVVCLVITFCFMALYMVTTRKVSKLSLSAVEIIKSKKTQAYIDNITQDNGVYVVYGAAKNSYIKYSFNNWVNGPGENLYKNYSLVMIDKNIDTIYKFKTYNKSFVATNEKVNALSSSGDGFVAYVPKKYAANDFRLGVLFTDRENHHYLVYLNKEIHI